MLKFDGREFRSVVPVGLFVFNSKPSTTANYSPLHYLSLPIRTMQRGQAEIRHPLKSTWSIWFIPAIDANVLKTFNGDYAKAAQATQRCVGEVKTVEELWSSLNVMPPPRNFPLNDTVMLIRGKLNPQYEDFPGGGRITISGNPDLLDQVTERVIIAVVGQQTELELAKLADADADELICSAVRIGRRKTKKDKEEHWRLEVWVTKHKFLAALVSYFQQIFADDKLAPIQVAGEPFEKAA